MRSWRILSVGLVLALLAGACASPSESTTTEAEASDTTSESEDTDTTADEAEPTTTSDDSTTSTTSEVKAFDDFAPPELTACFFLSRQIFVGNDLAGDAISALDPDVAAEPGYIVSEGEAIESDLDNLVDIITLEEDAPNAVLVTEFLRAQGIPASPIHAIGMANHWQFAPGDPPIGVGEELQDPGSPSPRGDVIAVVDTGLVPDDGDLSWVTDGVIFEQADAQDMHDLGASHGTFIVSLLRQISPGHRISFAAAHPTELEHFSSWPEGLIGSDEHPLQGLSTGVTTEFDALNSVERLIERHREDAPDQANVRVLNLSWGTYPCESSAPELDVDAMNAVLADWFRAFPGSAVFAAAGNAPASHGPFIPGALNGVVSGAPSDVHAVAAGGNQLPEVVWDHAGVVDGSGRAWVDLVVPGCDLLGAGGSSPDPFVAWSGSSFATAVAAGNYATDPALDASTALQVSPAPYPQVDQNRC